MNKNKMIAVAVALVVVGFFLFGGTVMDFFRGSSNEQLQVNQMQTTDQGFVKSDVVIGTGAEATNGSLLTVHYVGMLTDGQVFDSSVVRKTPFQFVLGAGQVIRGWDQGFAGMKVGGKRQIIIPPSMGYGPNQAGPIPPNSTLIFDVELLKVESAPAQQI
jgi:FKBP-type peptidyl-prolyl cis-trans isomerase